MDNTIKTKLFELMDIDKCFSNLYHHVKKEQKVAFFSAFIGGMLIHMYPFTNLMWNHDTRIGSQDASQNISWLLRQGKWFIEKLFVLEGMGSDYIIPFKIIIALFFLALAACLTVTVLQIKSSAFCALVGLLMAAFPSVTCIFMYDIKVYLWVIFFAVLSVYFQYIARTLWGRVASVFMLVLTLGSYPPYFTIVAGGYLLILIQETLNTDRKATKILCDAVALLVQLILGLIGYYAILQVNLEIKQKSLSAYQNIDTMTQLDFKKLPYDILNAYKKICEFFTQDSGIIQTCYSLMLFVLICSLLYLIIKNKIYRQTAKLILLLAFLSLYPLALNITFVINKGVGVHWLMMYGFVFVPLLAIMVVDKCYIVFNKAEMGEYIASSKLIFSTIWRWCALLLFSALAYRWALTCNECYLRASISYEKDYAVITKIADDIYENEFWDKEQPILFTYSVPDEHFERVQNLTVEYLPQYGGYTGVAHEEFMLAYDGVLERYLAMILGVGFPTADDVQRMDILKTEEYANMPRYPYNGYIEQINGVLVVKITDDSSLVW